MIEVRISALREGTFYAEVAVESLSGVDTVDARPSDAVSLARAVSAPIRVNRSIMDAEGMTPEERAARQQGPRPAWLPSGEPEPASRMVELMREAEVEARRFSEEHGLNRKLPE